MKIGRKENWKKRRGDGRSPSLLNLGFARGIFVPECRDRAASSRELQASLAFVGASESRVDRRREGWYYNLVVDESCGRQQSRTSSTLRESERVLSREFRVTDRATSALPLVFRIETSLSLSLSAFFTEIFAVSFRSYRAEEISSFVRSTLCKNVARYRRGGERGNEERVGRTCGTSHEMRSGNGK